MYVAITLIVSGHHRGSLMDSLNLEEHHIKSSGFVVDSLKASLWSLYTTRSHKEALLKAVNLGDDTDTIGAITSRNNLNKIW